MNKLQRLGRYLLLLLIFSACQKPFEFGFDIYEIAHYHNNGAGRFELMVDLTKARKFFRIESYINRSKPKRTQTLIKKAFQDIHRRLRGVQGISRISTAYDKQMLYFKLSLHFSSIRALNNAMRKISAHADRAKLTYFSMDRHSLVRLDVQSIVGLGEYYQARDDSYIASFDLKTFFKDVTHRTAYSFDREIKKVTNQAATISKSRRVVTLQLCLFNEKEGASSIGNQVFF